MKQLDRAALEAARQKREKEESLRRERAARLAAAGEADARRRKQTAAMQRAAAHMDTRNVAVLPERNVSGGYASASMQREPMPFTTRQTGEPRQRHMYPTVSRPADTMPATQNRFWGGLAGKVTTLPGDPNKKWKPEPLVLLTPPDYKGPTVTTLPYLINGEKPKTGTLQLPHLGKSGKDLLGGEQTPSQPVAGLPFMGANDLRKNIGRTQLDAFGGTIYNAAADAINRRNGENLLTLPGERDRLNADLAEVQGNIDRMEAFYREHGMHEDQLAYESQLAARDTLNKRIADMDSKIGQAKQAYDELEQRRPDSAVRQGLDQYQGIYGQYSEAYPGFSGYNAENIYDAGLKSPETADFTRSMMQQDARTLPGTMQSLSDMIARFEEAGMGDTQEVANMRKRLEDLNRRSDQLDHTGLRDNADFRAVVDDVKANGYKPGDKHADILSAVLDPEAYEKKHFMVNLMPFSPYVGPKNAAKYMTDDERDTFLYLWQTQGEDAAYQYFESMIPTGNQRFADTVRQGGEALGEASPIAGLAVGTVGSVVSAPGNLFGMAETGMNALTGQRTDPYGQNFAWNGARTGLQTGSREAVVNRFKKDGKETTASKLAGLGFDVVSTSIDNVATALAYGPLAPVVMALGSASSSTSDALIRSNGESVRSFFYGVGSGVAEYATEKIPMDQIGDMLAGKMKGIGAVLAHSLTEAPGEMLSTILSEVSDRAIMDAYSGYELSVQAMRQQGMSEEKARLIAERDFWIEVGYSGMLGWLSASGSALVSQGMDRVTGQGTAPEAQQPVQQETLPVQPAEAEPGSMLPQEAWLALPDNAAVADGQTVQEAAAVQEALPLGDMPVQEADAVRQTSSEAAADFATEAAVDQAAVDQSIAGNNADMTAFVPETTAAVQDETVREAGQQAARHAPQQAYYDSREEVGKRFRKLAKPLVEQTRDLWKRIQQIKDPILRTLKETAYEMLFQPLWDASINEQFYIDYPHLRPKQDVERRQRLKALAEAQMVSLQGDDAGAKGQVAWQHSASAWQGAGAYVAYDVQADTAADITPVSMSAITRKKKRKLAQEKAKEQTELENSTEEADVDMTIKKLDPSPIIMEYMRQVKETGKCSYKLAIAAGTAFMEDMNKEAENIKEQISNLDNSISKADDIAYAALEKSGPQDPKVLKADRLVKARYNLAKKLDWPELVKHTLSKYRPIGYSTQMTSGTFGGELFANRYETGSEKMEEEAYKKWVAEACDYYPADWLKYSTDAGKMLVGRANRAFYNHVGNGQYSFLYLDSKQGDKAISFHEMAHRLEQVVPGLLDAEKEYYQFRTAGCRVKELTDYDEGYEDGEVTRPDDFADPYMGKIYSGTDVTYYELCSMGFQYLFTNVSKFNGDTAMIQWLLGLLLLI